MKEKKSLEKILQTAKIAFLGGLALMLFCLLLANSGMDSVWVMAVCGGAGTAVCFGGIFYALAYFRCPHCGNSLMHGGRMPMSVPAYCSACGEKLNKNKESEI